MTTTKTTPTSARAALAAELHRLAGAFFAVTELEADAAALRAAAAAQNSGATRTVLIDLDAPEMVVAAMMSNDTGGNSALVGAHALHNNASAG